MTPQFITLPSGTVVNIAHIISARREDNGLAIFTTEGPFMAPEDLTMEAFLALLSPTTSAIVSHVLELRKPCIGDAVSFVWEDRHLHGVVDGASMNGYWISSGDTMFEWVPSTCQIILP